MRGVIALISLVSLGLVAACARDAQVAEPTVEAAIHESYRLMDQGETSRAVDLLERVVQREPSNNEARLMLASAYMGKAGVDVLSIHDSFADVLFSKSLSEVFFSGKKPADPTGDSALPRGGEKLTPEQQAEADSTTRAEKLIDDIDRFLSTLRRVVVIFNRFPVVPENNWPYLDSALSQLDKLPDANEVRVYRLFIRMVYLKEYLMKKVIKDQTFGSREWGCKLDLEELREGLLFTMGMMARATDDFEAIYVGQSSPFARAQAFFTAFEESLQRVHDDAPIGAETSSMVSQRRFREALRCNKSF